MTTQLGGYEDGDTTKSSALKEVTITTDGTKNRLDVGVSGSYFTPVGGYGINNLDDDGNDANANYYGFEASDGSWYIMKEDKSSNPVVYTYSTGSSGYSTAWTNRASQSYDTFGNTF